MDQMLQEIEEIPAAAKLCYESNKELRLPENVPYLGMGASYYAPLTLWYLGKNIRPYIASEYVAYQGKEEKQGVLISQSGESSEVLWSQNTFGEIVAMTNTLDSTLATASNCKQAVNIQAGKESFTSTKTYFNTLVALYIGLGVDPGQAITAVERQFEDYKTQMGGLARELADSIKKNTPRGLFVLGSGPNVATAKEGALTLSESTKYAWQGLSVAQYDHGPKETAQDSIVLFLQSSGKDADRIAYLINTLEKKSNALVREVVVDGVPEELSPFCHIAQLNLLMAYMAQELDVQGSHIGKKVTRFEV